MGYFKELDIESADAGRTHEQNSGVEPARVLRTECDTSELVTEVAVSSLSNFDFGNVGIPNERNQQNPDQYSFLYW